ncbi:MAG: hypothetical protein ACLQDL_14370 [Spirochaetia bacterium]
MKHPVLKIKKGAVVYDDTDALRASEVPRPALPGSGPLVSRRRRRSRGPFTFIPLLVVAMGLFIVFRVLPNTPVNRAALAGWQVTLRVTPYQDLLIVGVTFISGTLPAKNAASAPPAAVRISFPGTAALARAEGLLEKSPMTLRVDLPRIRGAKKVEAEVSIGGVRATLWVPVPPEKPLGAR